MYRQLDNDGRFEGLNADELTAAHDFLDTLNGSSWIADLCHRDAREEDRLQAEAELAKVVEVFQGFTEAQRTFFFQEFYPRRFNLASIARLCEALSVE